MFVFHFSIDVPWSPKRRHIQVDGSVIARKRNIRPSSLWIRMLINARFAARAYSVAAHIVATAASRAYPFAAFNAYALPAAAVITAHLDLLDGRNPFQLTA